MARWKHLLSLTKCDECSLKCGVEDEYGSYPFRPVTGVGPLDAELVLVGEAPGRDEFTRRAPFVGKAGEVLNVLLDRAGTERDKVYITNTVLCHPLADRAPSPEEIAACSGRLRAELSQLTNHKMILVMGATAAMAMLGSKQSMGRLNGKVFWSNEWNCYLAFSFHPAANLYAPNYYLDTEWAFKRAMDVLTGRDVAQRDAKERSPYFVDRDPEHAADEIARLTEELRGKWVACDIESDGFDFMTDRLLELGFNWGEHTYILPESVWQDERVKDALCTFFEHPDIKWVWHNGKFDLHFIWHYVEAKARIDADTMLMHYSIDERSGGGDGVSGYDYGSAHDLKTLSQRYCNAPAWADELYSYLGPSGKMSDVPEHIRNAYHGCDVDYTYKLYHIMRKKLQGEKSPRNSRYWTPEQCHDQLLVPAANMLAAIEYRGVLVDRKEMENLKEQIERQMREAYNSVILSAVQWTRHWKKPLLPSSPMQISKLIYTAEPIGMGIKKYFSVKQRVIRDKDPARGDTLKPSTQTAVLNEMRRNEGDIPFIENMLRYREIAHLYRVYVKGLMQRLDVNDRLHTNFLLHGTNTGRLSSQNPNLQNIPRESPIKALFVASPGYVFVNADFKALEMTTAAWYSRDPGLITSLQEKDMHWTMAHDILPDLVNPLEKARGDIVALEHLVDTVGIYSHVRTYLRHRKREDPNFVPDPEDIYYRLKTRIRFQNKHIAFGILYGRGPRSLQDSAEGIGCTKEEATFYIRNFNKKYPAQYRFARWLEEMAEAQEWHFVETPFGRRRRFPLIVETNKVKVRHNAVNMPIQSLASDIALCAATRLHTDLTERGWGHIVLLVHDSIAFEIREDVVDEAMEYIKVTMEGTMERMHPGSTRGLPIKVDISKGASWAEAK